MGSTQVSLFILPLSFTFLFTQFPSATSDISLVENVCRATMYYNLCISTLVSDPSSRKSDTKGLAAIMVKKSQASATSSYTYILSQKPARGSAEELCGYHFDCAIQALRESTKELRNGNFDAAGRATSNAREQVKTCGSDFARLGHTYPPILAKREVLLEQLCDTASTIISSL